MFGTEGIVVRAREEGRRKDAEGGVYVGQGSHRFASVVGN